MKNSKPKPRSRTRRGSTFFDRRRLDSRRTVYSLDYFGKGGVERRKFADRRQSRLDRRKGWTRISKWSSILTDSNSEIEDESA